MVTIKTPNQEDKGGLSNFKVLFSVILCQQVIQKDLPFRIEEPIGLNQKGYANELMICSLLRFDIVEERFF